MAPRCGTKHGTRQWINLEPCGLFCGSITWFLILFGMYGTTFEIIVPWLGYSWFGILNIILFNGLSLMAWYTHVKTMTTDPGSVPKSARPLHDDHEERDYENAENKTDLFKKFCRKCKAFKPLRAHHCSICGRCIVKMDHHCPWVNNCVGVGNHKLFLLFVFWIFLLCMYTLILMLAKFILCSSRDDECGGDASSFLITVFLVMEGLLFGLFTICMLGDQMSSVYTNQTQIDRLKNTKFEHLAEINEVCGGSPHVSFSWSWLWPTPLTFKNPDLHERVHGFRTEDGEEMSPLLVASAVHGTPPARQRKLPRGTEAHKGLTEETCSEDSYDADTITEWLQDANSIEGDSDAGHIEMNATSGFFQKLKSDSPEQARSDATASPGNTSSAAEHSNIRKRTNGA